MAIIFSKTYEIQIEMFNFGRAGVCIFFEFCLKVSILDGCSKNVFKTASRYAPENFLEGFLLQLQDAGVRSAAEQVALLPDAMT